MRADFVAMVERYVAGEIGLDELEEWEAGRFQSLGSLSPDDPVFRLWGRLHGYLAEMDLGHRSEDNVREALKLALREVDLVIIDTPLPATAAAVGRQALMVTATIELDPPIPIPSGRIEHVTVAL